MAAMMDEVLPFSEAEMYIEALKTIPLREIGSPRWRTQHEYIEKLNMQAVLNASNSTDEFVQEFLVSHNKISLLIYDLLSVELWQNRIFKYLLEMEISSNSTLPIYMTLFHEVTVLGLLETSLYHKEPCECAGDNILDLVDYCCRKITNLIIRSERDEKWNDEVKINEQLSNKQDLEKQSDSIMFNVCLKALSLLSYITDHMTSMPLGVMTRLLNTHDMPCLLVHVLDISPWKRTTKEGKLQLYVNKEWKNISTSEDLKLQKVEGQIWISLYHLLMNQEAQRKYEFTNNRKNTILKLRKYLNETLLDQIPYLADMQRYLEELSIMETPTSKKELIIEQVPEIRDALEKEYSGKWRETAEFQMREYFTPSERQMKDQALKWAATYNLDVLESLVEDPPKCALCGQEATKRCSRCRNEWYCTRPCQVKHWAVHKPICAVISENSMTMS